MDKKRYVIRFKSQRGWIGYTFSDYPFTSKGLERAKRKLKALDKTESAVFIYTPESYELVLDSTKNAT